MGCVIELTSITYAITARDLLRKNRVSARVEKSAGKIKNGCAYSVVVDDNCKNATNLLKNAGIKILDIT